MDALKQRMTGRLSLSLIRTTNRSFSVPNLFAASLAVAALVTGCSEATDSTAGGVGVAGAPGASPDPSAGKGGAPGGHVTAGTQAGGNSPLDPAMGGSNGGGGGTATGGNSVGGEAAGGAGNTDCVPGDTADPYAKRCGPFKVLAYSKTLAYDHADSIEAGAEVLKQLGQANNFEVTHTRTDEHISDAGLAQFEVIFFLSPTGDVFNASQRKAFEDWMNDGGAFVGIHSATVVAKGAGWGWYDEFIGQYFNEHGPKEGDIGTVTFEPSVLQHPAVRGVPNPWMREEEFYGFDNHQMPGFEIVARVAGSKEPGIDDGQPIMWLAQRDTYRMFYTQLGHHPATLRDENFKKMLLGAILWSARRAE